MSTEPTSSTTTHPTHPHPQSHPQSQSQPRAPPPDARFTLYPGPTVPEDLLDRCARLFSAHYGVWNDQAAVKVSPFLKAGQHVKLNAKKLRAQSLEPAASSVLVTCFRPRSQPPSSSTSTSKADEAEGGESDELVGHAFATVWAYEGGTAGWITQLIVHPAHRRQHIATHLVQTLRTHKLFQHPNLSAVGLASSHPASVAVLAKFNDVNAEIKDVNTSFISTHAPRILAATPINYLKGAPLLGSLFSSQPQRQPQASNPSPAGVGAEPGVEPGAEPGVVSNINTQFFIDHSEPRAVLQAFKDRYRDAAAAGEKAGVGALKRAGVGERAGERTGERDEDKGKEKEKEKDKANEKADERPNENQKDSGGWTLGELQPGCEFLIVVPVLA